MVLHYNTLVWLYDVAAWLGVTPVGRGRGVLSTPLRESPSAGANIGRPGMAGRRPPADNLFSSDPALPDLINGPLTQVLKQLSITIDPNLQASTKGLLLRPEYYIQHVDKKLSVKSLDHTKLSFKELMSDIGRVMLHLSSTGGDLISYVHHFTFIAKQAAVHNFTDSLCLI